MSVFVSIVFSQFLSLYNWNSIFFLIILILFFTSTYLLIKYNSEIKKTNQSLHVQCVLNKSIREKELLLKELHHRVKNNLQIIVSLLNIQSRINKHPQIDLFIAKSESRIRSMLLIHEMLCRCENVSKVDFKAYLNTLIENIYNTYDLNHVKYFIDTDEIYLNLETAIPLGLIVNELLNNSLKYAFPNKTKGCVNIKIFKAGDKRVLSIHDNGVGFDIDEKKLGSIGLDIVSLLVEQMSAEFEIKVNNGVLSVIKF